MTKGDLMSIRHSLRQLGQGGCNIDTNADSAATRHRYGGWKIAFTDRRSWAKL